MMNWNPAIPCIAAMGRKGGSNVAADYIAEMHCRRPFERGVPAREGVEF